MSRRTGCHSIIPRISRLGFLRPACNHCPTAGYYLPPLPRSPSMPTPCRALGAATLLASLVAPLAAQEAAEVCKSIGHVTVGQWASYDATGSKGGGKVRFAIVGSERRGDTTLYWFEISGSGPRDEGIMQVLVPGFGLETSGIRGMVVKTGAQPAMKLPDQMLATVSQRMAANNPALLI